MTREKWEVKIAEELELQAEEDRQEESFKKALGFRFKGEAWVHPRNGGDDYQIVGYFNDKQEAAKEMKHALLIRNSVSLNDLAIVTL